MELDSIISSKPLVFWSIRHICQESFSGGSEQSELWPLCREGLRSQSPLSRVGPRGGFWDPGIAEQALRGLAPSLLVYRQLSFPSTSHQGTLHCDCWSLSSGRRSPLRLTPAITLEAFYAETSSQGHSFTLTLLHNSCVMRQVITSL